jgi:hypothetical protein
MSLVKQGAALMTYLSVTQLESRRRLLEDELRLAEARAVARPVTPRPYRRRRRLLTAVRGAAAA